MADDATITDGIAGTLLVAADEVAGKKIQRVKIQHGADGSATDASTAAPFPVDDDATQVILTAIQALLALPVQSATATLSNVSGATSSTTLIASNANRKGLVIVNDSTSVMYAKFGSAASSTSYTYYLAGTVSGVPATLELSGSAVYTGIVTGIWVSAAGAARVTELT